MGDDATCHACGCTEHKFLWEKNGCRITRCAGCGLGRADTEGFDPKAYYTQDFFDGHQNDGYVDYAGSEAVLREEFRGVVEDLRRHVPEGTLLELGAAHGFFLMEANEHFDVHGIEISDHAAAFARSRNLDVRTGSLTDDLLADIGQLDAVVMLDVIEHVENPGDTLRLCSLNLRKGGVIVATTGDFGSIFAKLTGRGWRLMTPPLHLWFLTKSSVEKMAAPAGLEVVEIEHPWKRVPLSLIFYQLGRFIGVHIPPKMLTWASGLGIPINLFDAMKITLRKV